jgi:N-carbamoylputrescine amidase
MQSPPPLNVALIQMSMTADAPANLARVADRVSAAAAAGANVVCLPELFATPYFCQRENADNFDLAEPVDGPTTRAMANVARDCGVVLIAPIFERRAAGVYHNSAVVLDEAGRPVGLYRKMHIPDDPGYYEKYYFTPGDLGFPVFRTRFASVGVLICWDQWYPEAARLSALAGAEILFYPTAIGWHPRERAEHGPQQLRAWRTVQCAHAIANGVYVAAVNRTGHEADGDGDGIDFWGSSFVCDPFGQIIAEAGVDGEETVLAEIDPGRIEQVRRNWPFLRDRRVDAYGGITERLIADGGAET